MGRKSKLKKLKKQTQQQTPQMEETKFVDELQHRGYSLKSIQRSPLLPTKQIKPQI